MTREEKRIARNIKRAHAAVRERAAYRLKLAQNVRPFAFMSDAECRKQLIVWTEWYAFDVDAFLEMTKEAH